LDGNWAACRRRRGARAPSRSGSSFAWAVGRARPGACPSVPRSLAMRATAAGVDDLQGGVSWCALHQGDEMLPFIAGRGGSAATARRSHVRAAAGMQIAVHSTQGGSVRSNERLVCAGQTQWLEEATWRRRPWRSKRGDDRWCRVGAGSPALRPLHLRYRLVEASRGSVQGQGPDPACYRGANREAYALDRLPTKPGPGA
jgi:hypothetical protein